MGASHESQSRFGLCEEERNLLTLPGIEPLLCSHSPSLYRMKQAENEEEKKVKMKEKRMKGIEITEEWKKKTRRKQMEEVSVRERTPVSSSFVAEICFDFFLLV
jgi:hypothetical protein